MCVKIIVNGDGKESRRELKYYRHLSKRDISWDMLPRYFGNIETDKGTGDLWELVCDYDGSPSKSLNHFLKDEARTSEYADGLVSALERLRAYQIENRIITMGLKAHNLLYRRTSETNGKFYIVDGIGSSDLIPISKYSQFFGKKKIIRKWDRFLTYLSNRYADNKAVAQIVQQLVLRVD